MARRDRVAQGLSTSAGPPAAQPPSCSKDRGAAPGAQFTLVHRPRRLAPFTTSRTRQASTDFLRTLPTSPSEAIPTSCQVRTFCGLVWTPFTQVNGTKSAASLRNFETCHRRHLKSSERINNPQVRKNARNRADRALRSHSSRCCIRRDRSAKSPRDDGKRCETTRDNEGLKAQVTGAFRPFSQVIESVVCGTLNP
jgi:hypothetical protein